MNDDTLRSAYAEFLSSRGSGRTDCATPEALLAVADGSASEADRLTTLRHVGRCRACQADLDLLRSARIAAESTDSAPRWERWPAMAAAVVLVIAGGLAIRAATRGTTTDVMRDGTASFQLLAPIEDTTIAPPVRLVWSSLPDAIRYEVEVVTPGGQVAFRNSTRDTALTVPSEVVVHGADYRWWVVGVLPQGDRRSATRRLRIAKP